jgi:uncharacterized protein with NRDE domain
MCIFFLYYGDKSIGDTHRIILASNRDEFHSRQTKRVAYGDSKAWKRYIAR